MSEARRAGSTPIYQRTLLDAASPCDGTAPPSVSFRRDLRDRADELHRFAAALNQDGPQPAMDGHR